MFIHICYDGIPLFYIPPQILTAAHCFFYIIKWQKKYYQCEGSYLQWQKPLERKKRGDNIFWLNFCRGVMSFIFKCRLFCWSWLLPGYKAANEWRGDWTQIYKWLPLFLRVKMIVNIAMNMKPNIGGLTKREEINTRWNCKVYHRVFSVTGEGLHASGLCYAHITSPADFYEDAMLSQFIAKRQASPEADVVLQLHIWNKQFSEFGNLSAIDLTAVLLQCLYRELSVVKFTINIIHIYLRSSGLDSKCELIFQKGSLYLNYINSAFYKLLKYSLCHNI